MGRRPRGTSGPSARWRGSMAATEQGAGTAGTPRGSAARGHHKAQRARGAWFNRRDASFVSAGNRRCPACSQTAGCNSFERPRDIRSAIVPNPTFRTGLLHVGTVGSIRTHCVLPTLREISDFPLAVRMPCVLPTLPDVVRQAARIRRILVPSRESIALPNNSEPRAARRRRRLAPCERAARR